MNSKNKKTLKAIFASPVKESVSWQDIENLFLAVGAELIEGRGSRIRFSKETTIATFHRPYPIKDARNFLMQLGVKL